MAETQVQTRATVGEGRQPEPAGAKVTVACNLPSGIWLRNHRMIPTRELVMGGGVVETKRAERVGEPILIHGIATEVGKLSAAPVIAGYALTFGVDKDAWDAWLKDNENSAMVKNKCIFAYERADDAQAAAKDNTGRRTGLEPFQKDNDPRAPRPSSNLSRVSEEEGRAKAA